MRSLVVTKPGQTDMYKYVINFRRRTSKDEVSWRTKHNSKCKNYFFSTIFFIYLWVELCWMCAWLGSQFDRAYSFVCDYILFYFFHSFPLVSVLRSTCAVYTERKCSNKCSNSIPQVFWMVRLLVVSMFTVPANNFFLFSFFLFIVRITGTRYQDDKKNILNWYHYKERKNMKFMVKYVCFEG